MKRGADACLNVILYILAVSALFFCFFPMAAQASAVYSEEKIQDDFGFESETDSIYGDSDVFTENFIDDITAVSDYEISPASLLGSSLTFVVPPNSSGSFTLTVYYGYSGPFAAFEPGNVYCGHFELTKDPFSVSSNNQTYVRIDSLSDKINCKFSVNGYSTDFHMANNAVNIPFPCLSSGYNNYSYTISREYVVSYYNSSSSGIYTCSLTASVAASPVSFSIINTGVTLASLYDDTTYEKLLYDFWNGSNWAYFDYKGNLYSNTTFMNVVATMTNYQSGILRYIDGLYNFLAGKDWYAYRVNGKEYSNISLISLMDIITENQYRINESINNQGSNIVSELENLTNGYQNEELASGSAGFESSLTGFTDSMGVIVNGVDSDLGDPSLITHIFDFTAGLNSALQLVGSFETAFLISSGDLTTLIPLMYSLVFLSILIGLWRFFRR